MKYLNLLFCFITLLSSAVTANEQPFELWLQELKADAVAQGVTRETVAYALEGVTFIERVISKDRAQPEFKESYQDYIGKRVTDWRINKGREYLAAHNPDMAIVTQSYGVPARVVAAILGVETNYGTYKLKHPLFNVLATLAYDKRRGARFRKEVFAALKILDSQQADLIQLKSSWAGALGSPQFMPSTYSQFAVDFDKDGKKDIWQHGPDLWASVANYLSHYGWDARRTWSRKVRVPIDKQNTLPNETINLSPMPKACERYRKHLKGWQNLNSWNNKGLRRMNGMDLPKVNLAASLLLTDPSMSHGYLVYENFCVLMRYNPSFKYALSVGVLSDNLK